MKHQVSDYQRYVSITEEGPQWDALLKWYEDNGMNLDITVNNGTTQVEDGVIYIWTIEPTEFELLFDARTFVEDNPKQYFYQVPVTPIPDEVWGSTYRDNIDIWI